MPSATRARSLLDWFAVAALCVGETLAGLLGWRWLAVGPFSVVFVAGAGLLVVRHILWPRPSILSLAADRLRACGASEGGGVAWRLALTTRVAVLVVGLVAVQSAGDRSVADQPRISRNPLVDLPLRFDAGWYLGLARHGYDWRPELLGHRSSIAFFPAYPLVMRVAGDLVTVPAKAARAPTLFGNGDGRVLWGGLLASVLCFGLALQRVYRLARLDGAPPATATRASALLAAYPFAVFFGVPYSESLFLLTLTSTVLAWRSQRPGGALAWGLAAGLTRSNGWSLSIALLINRMASVRRLEDRSLPWPYALGPLLGALLYSAFVYALTGHPLAWVAAQTGWGRAVAPWTFFARRWDTLTSLGLVGYVRADPVDATAFVATLLCLVAAAMLAQRGRWLYAALVAAYLLPALAIDLPAVGRMTAVLFPVFLLLGERLRASAFATVAIVFGLLQLYFAGRFFLWMTPY